MEVVEVGALNVNVKGQISKISSLYLVGCLVLGAQVDAFEFGV